jgi:hypothetical protein
MAFVLRWRGVWCRESKPDQNFPNPWNSRNSLLYMDIDGGLWTKNGIAGGCNQNLIKKISVSVFIRFHPFSSDC